MSSALTVGERIILHLDQYAKYIDSYDAPLDVSQDGIAVALRISRAHAAIELKKLKDSGEVVEKLVHIKRGKTKRKVYFLTSPGEERGRRIRQYADSEGIDIHPFLDIKRCKGPELWGALEPEHRAVLAQACVFRRPFPRHAVPETTVALLPVDEEGMVDLPASIKTYVQGQTAPELLRQYHSHAADHWLSSGDYRERLYHLVRAGRAKEAEMLLGSKGAAPLGPYDRDLLSIVTTVTPTVERYRIPIIHAQAEVALSAGDLNLALAKARELQAVPKPAERSKGLVVEALVLRAGGDLDGSLSLLRAAAEASSVDDVHIQCEIAETLLQAGRGEEARAALDQLMAKGGGDGDQLERIFYQMGMVSLRAGKGAEAVRFFSKSRGTARNKENGDLYLRLSDAYGLMGMADKAEEYALRAKRVNTPRVTM